MKYVTCLFSDWLLLVKLKSSLGKCYSGHRDLVSQYGISVTNDHGYVSLVVGPLTHS